MRFVLFSCLFIFSCGSRAFIQNPKYKVMVSYSKHTSFGQMMRNHPDFIETLDDQGYYETSLFEMTATQRDHIAVLAHADNGFCGSLLMLESPTVAIPLSLALPSVFPTQIPLDAVSNLLSQVNSQKIGDGVRELEVLPSRFHQGATGALAVSTIKAIWSRKLPTGVSVVEVDGGVSTTQKSLVVKILGTQKPEESVIVGSHIDSIAPSNSSQNAPGADDNATGVSTIAELLRIVTDNNIKFQRTIEFHGYAAEEVGLVGSQALASTYQSANKAIAGMLQIDMTGYATSENQGKIFLITNDTSPVITKQLKELSSSYGLDNATLMKLPSGRSDHVSWTDRGMHAGFAFEHPTKFNPSIHTANDTSSKLNFDYSQKFAKLSLAWLAHTAGIDDSSSRIQSEERMLALKSKASEISISVIERSTSEGNVKRFVASAPEGTELMSACLMSTLDESNCKGQVSWLKPTATRSGRSFFVSEDLINPDTGVVYRFTTHGAVGLVTSLRDVKFEKR